MKKGGLGKGLREEEEGLVGAEGGREGQQGKGL